MLLGELLFFFAVVVIAGGALAGMLLATGRALVSKLLGLETGPRPEPGSAEWARTVPTGTVDLGRRSFLTEHERRSAREPVVTIGGIPYRATRLGPSRYLVTRLDEGRRIGTFLLEGEGRTQTVVPEPDEPAAAAAIVQVAALSSLRHTCPA